jgi:hypothetical protein
LCLEIIYRSPEGMTLKQSELITTAMSVLIEACEYDATQVIVMGVESLEFSISKFIRRIKRGIQLSTAPPIDQSHHKASL